MSGLLLSVLWIGGVTFFMASLATIHGVSFFPDKNVAPSQATAGRWTLTHVIGEGCKCSRQVYLYLLKRGPLSDADENVVILGKMPQEAQELQAHGFKVSFREARSLASEKAIGVPFLLITSDKGEAVYAGGYASSEIRESTAIQDLSILASLHDGKVAKEFPIFGCAVSQHIQSLIDPMKFKYKESL